MGRDAETGRGRKARLQRIALAMVGAYAAVLAATVAVVGVEELATDRGFWRFAVVAGAASPLVLGALVLSRLALGSAVVALVAAASTLLMLVRVARAEASAASMKFAAGWLLLLLLVELCVGRWEARRREPS